MLTQAVIKRRKDCSVLWFIAFILVFEAVIALPGFLYFYFWEGAGLPFSAFIGLLLGNLVLSVLEGLGEVVAFVRRLLGMAPVSKKRQKKESVPGAEGEQRQHREIHSPKLPPETRLQCGSTQDKESCESCDPSASDPPLHADTPNER